MNNAKINEWIKPTKIAKNKEEIGQNHKVSIVCQNSFSILIEFNNLEDDQTIVEKVGECKIMNMVMKELEIKEELCNIEIIKTQALETILEKLVLDQV